MAPNTAWVRVRVRGIQPYAHMAIVRPPLRMRHTQCVASRTFVKFTFIRVQPEWRRREPADRARDKREFAAACRDFAEDHLLRTYSLVGTRGDCDLMVRTVAPSLDPIHDFHVLLNRAG